MKRGEKFCRLMLLHRTGYCCHPHLAATCLALFLFLSCTMLTTCVGFTDKYFFFRRDIGDLCFPYKRGTVYIVVYRKEVETSCLDVI